MTEDRKESALKTLAFALAAREGYRTDVEEQDGKYFVSIPVLEGRVLVYYRYQLILEEADD